MKDLYRRLGLPGQEDDLDVIRRALQAGRHDPADREAAGEILLHLPRKAVYDRDRAVLVRIGELRANLGLGGSEGWARSDCSDFDVDPTAGSQLERLRWPRPEEEEAAGPPWTSTLRAALRFAVPVILVALVVFVALGYAVSR